jgi:hypothetical protein
VVSRAGDPVLADAVPSAPMAVQLADLLMQRVYTFKVERFNLGEVGSGYGPNLAPDSANFPNALRHLWGRDPSRFQAFTPLVRVIFLDVDQITVVTAPGSRLQTKVWPVDPKTEREDLAQPPAESGTAIGQVLAILYVVLTSKCRQLIIIDEPQSFVHPGATRRLFDALRHESRHPHQYIVTTHSSTVVTAAAPQTLLLVRKEEAVSRIDPIGIAEADDLGLFLSEIGARPAEVFGADRILRIEWATEELCFPLILERLGRLPLWGTQILGVRQTGDLEGKHAKTILEIHTRLNPRRGLLPPALSFVFGREGRPEPQRQDLRRQIGGLMRCLGAGYTRTTC